MTQSNAKQTGDRHVPTLLSLGFRPFFLFGSLWAAIAMVIWIGMLAGSWVLPTHFAPVSWHAHEFLFGYLGAIIAGFLLTAVPNWTGRLPIVGWRLGVLLCLWIIGRFALAISLFLPAVAAAALDLAFPVLLSVFMIVEIIAGKNWRNLIVIAILTAFIVANGLFHWEAAIGDYAAQGMGLRLGLASSIMLISVVGGRVVPSFTRNWLALGDNPARPVAPMQLFDKLTLVATLLILLVWVAAPDQWSTGAALLFMGGLHFIRLSRWRGFATSPEALLFVLHIAYAFLPLGAIGLGLGILFPQILSATAFQHLWMAGALGLMTLAVMSRATLGHTGQPLRAGVGTIGIYGFLVASVLLRLLANTLPEHAANLYNASGGLWIASFGGFALLYGRLLLRPRQKFN